jgi:hypothetical protein
MTTKHEVSMSAHQSRGENLKIAVENFSREFLTYLGDAKSLVQEIMLLRNHPGWSDMSQIIVSVHSTQYIEGTKVASQKTMTQLKEWEGNWNIPWTNMYQKYSSLAKRSRDLDTQRLRILDDLEKLHRDRINYTVSLYLSAPELASMSNSTDFIERMNQEKGEFESMLNTYSLDSLGLYTRRLR